MRQGSQRRKVITKEELLLIMYSSGEFEFDHDIAADRILATLDKEREGEVVLKYCNTWDSDDLDSIYGYVAGKKGSLIFRPTKENV